jgi:FkbM family methyltransferase
VLRGIPYSIARAVRRRVLGPHRLRWYLSRKEPFIHRSRFGLTFELEPDQFIDRYILIDGLYEDRFLEFIGRLLPPEAVVLDVGANIGNHALYLARRCAEVHCFEPHPAALERLRRHISINGIHNIVVHPFGLGDKDEVAPFYEVSGNLGAGTFVGAGASGLALPIRNADNAIAELDLQRIDFIKVDVEDMEERVFRGLKKTLERFRPLIDFEFHGEHRSNDDFRAIRDHLRGYRISEVRFSPDGAGVAERFWRNVTRAGTPDLVPVETPESRWYENLLAIPNGVLVLKMFDGLDARVRSC